MSQLMSCLNCWQYRSKKRTSINNCFMNFTKAILSTLNTWSKSNCFNFLMLFNSKTSCRFKLFKISLIRFSWLTWKFKVLVFISTFSNLLLSFRIFSIWYNKHLYQLRPQNCLLLLSELLSYYLCVFVVRDIKIAVCLEPPRKINFNLVSNFLVREISEKTGFNYSW